MVMETQDGKQRVAEEEVEWSYQRLGQERRDLDRRRRAAQTLEKRGILRKKRQCDHIKAHNPTEKKCCNLHPYVRMCV